MGNRFVKDKAYQIGTVISEIQLSNYHVASSKWIAGSWVTKAGVKYEIFKQSIVIIATMDKLEYIHT